MKVLFDTSVLVAALVEAHPEHARSMKWFERAVSGKVGFLVAAHTLAELYSVLTAFPVSPRISPGNAWLLIHQNVEEKANVVALSSSEYSACLRSLADLGLAGVVVYDGLIAWAARKSAADRLLTLNPDDFCRVWPEGAGSVVAP